MKKLLILIGFTYALTANAQDYFITFAGEGASSAVASVNVENLTSGTSLVISGSDILHLTSITTGVSPVKNDPLSKIMIYPNPMTDYSTIRIYPPVKGDAVISVIDITGKQIAQLQSYLENSRQEFRLSGVKNGFYLINVLGSNYHFLGKLISNGKFSGAISIEKVNNNIQAVDEKELKKTAKGSQTTVDMQYTTGDLLKFTGISGKYSTVKTDIPIADKTITFNFIACSDADENNYPVVEIGDQVWMAVNLKTSKYSDGTGIPIGIDFPGWYAITNDGFCWNNYDESRKNSGGFYNWYAVDVASNGNKNLCPAGWHVPSYVDWVTMENYLISNGFNYDGTTIGNKIAKSLAATSDWYNPFTKGAPGNNDYPAYRNKTGFSANPTGWGPNGQYHGKEGYWWSATGIDAKTALSTIIDCGDPAVVTEFSRPKNSGLTVRCIKGEAQLLPVLTTKGISNIKSNKATSGGNITNDGNTPITTRGVCWSTSSNPTIADYRSINGIGAGEFTSTIYGLPETTYYVRAYATNSVGTGYGNEFIFKTYAGSVTDLEYNNYNTTRIGDQIWMAENLRSTRYTDDTPIPLISDAAAWSTLSSPGYCWYNNDVTDYKTTYGALYNWYAIDLASNGSKKVCPPDWHLPTYEEWLTMENYLIAKGYNFDGSTSGNKIAKSLAATTNWYTTSQEGTPGNTDYPAYRNKTGFTAFPTGIRNFNGDFTNGGYGSWWSATGVDAQFAWFVQIWWDNIILYIDNINSKKNGYSIRCLKPLLTTTIISYITQTTAASGGNIANEGNSTITAHGVCWSTSSNPTIEDNKTSDGSGAYPFISSITGLTANTTYYVRAYATNSEGTSYGNELTFKTYSGDVTDIEGNIYNTVTIGTQVWMAENLKTTEYNNGDLIDTTSPATRDISGESTPKYQWAYDGNENLVPTYGRLYTGHAILDNRNVCPTGWHVPDISEWNTLENYLIANGYNYDGTLSGNKIGKSLAAATNWNTTIITGTVGNSDFPEYRNKTGFSAQPSGSRGVKGFSDLGTFAVWWSVTLDLWDELDSKALIVSNTNLNDGEADKNGALAVRCVKNY